MEVLPAAPALAGASLAPAGDTGFVPWNPDTLRPLFAEIVPLIETADVESLRREALKLSPEAAALVAKKAPWGEATKATLVSGGAAVCAKWMNRFGISAEWMPELTLAVAVVSIVSARTALKTEIRKMIEEAKPKNLSMGGNSGAIQSQP